MDGYLGQIPVDIETSVFKGWGPADWAMYFIERYGQMDGEHHKAWVLDQIARIHNGTPVVVEQAWWDNGYNEYRVWLGEPSPRYLEWVENMKGGGKYDYDEGIAP